jgi:hypothetical protein
MVNPSNLRNKKQRSQNDAYTFTVSERHKGEFRAIEVAGGLFQLDNRSIVHNCEWKPKIWNALFNNCPITSFPLKFPEDAVLESLSCVPQEINPRILVSVIKEPQKLL